MNSKIKDGLTKKIKQVMKNAGYVPYLYSLGGMISIGLLFLGFNFLTFNGDIWVYLLVFLIFFIFFAVGLPLMYGVSLLVSNATRFRKEKSLNIKTCFDKYHHGNPGFFGIGTIIFKGILIDLLGMFVAVLVIGLIARIPYPDMVTIVVNLYSGVYPAGTTVADALGTDYYNIFLAFSIIVECLGHIPIIVFASSELRKNESVYYAANVLVADNYVDVATRPLIPLFRGAILPLVKSEYKKYNFAINYLGYIVFFTIYIGLSVLGIFLMNVVDYYLVNTIAFGVAIVCYFPFYYKQRVFDALFYIAYSDKIMDRAGDKIRQIIHAGRSQIEPTIQKAKEQQEEEETSFDSKNFSTDTKEARDRAAKKGEYDSFNNEVDFTHRDKNDEDKN